MKFELNMQDIPITLKIKISGEAGDGILTIGDLLMKAAASKGYYSTVYKSYPPNVRGGYSQALVTISEEKIISPISAFDIIFSIAESSLQTEISKLEKGNLILIESEVYNKKEIKEKVTQVEKKGISVLSVPVIQLTKDTAGPLAIRSTVTLGILSVLIGLPQDLLVQIISERFRSKGRDILNLNIKALSSGFFWAKNNPGFSCHCRIPALPADTEERIILGGNQAISIGSIAAGCTFFASYPITPATLIGDNLASYLLTAGGFAYQAEDEIAALGSVIGASFSGAKAMTATSGPGLSLMQEFIGYASMVELPIVIIDVQRVGPSTGMPTKHAQDDLLAAAFGGHGDSPRIILSPSSVEDCFYLTIEAFNLSERYQCPVILLSDGALGMVKETLRLPDFSAIKVVERNILKGPVEDDPFLRFKITENGINPIAVPGISRVTYRATGVEHGEDSTPGESPEIRTRQINKRFSKVRYIEKENESLLKWDLEESSYKADFSIIGWGITASICRQAVLSMRLRGYRIAALYPKIIFPVCRDAIGKLLQFSSRLFVPEANFTGQYSRLIRMYHRCKTGSDYYFQRGTVLSGGD